MVSSVPIPGSEELPIKTLISSGAALLLTFVVSAQCANGSIAVLSCDVPGANAAITDGSIEQAKQGFERYASSVEARIRKDWPAFLVLAPDAPARARLRASRTLVRPARSLGIELPSTPPTGQIQHWVGATFIPGATLAAAIPRLEDYDRRKQYMSPEVTESQLLRRQGDDFEVYLRVTEKSVISAKFDVYLTIHYGRLDETHLMVESRSERITEVPGEATSSSPDRGLLWGLNHYWRIAEMDGGLYLECEALVLSRKPPAMVRWIADPLISKAARKTLINTIEATRRIIESKGH